MDVKQSSEKDNMETPLISDTIRGTMEGMIAIAVQDSHAEVECKVLSGQIRTKDELDRIVDSLEDLQEIQEEHRATFIYPDGLRVTVKGADNILKVCNSNSFNNIPLQVERKRKYYDVPGKIQTNTNITASSTAFVDVVDIPELKLRCTLRHEEPLKKDFGGSPMDPVSHVRVMHRRSWTDGMFRVDISMVKTKQSHHKTMSEILRQQPTYEVEVELVYKEGDLNIDIDAKSLTDGLIKHVEPIIAAFQESNFILRESDKQKYKLELESMKLRFVNPVTLERRHLIESRPHNILSGYTVTNKADGERSLLIVTRDRRLIRLTKPGKITWTGITANNDTHVGDVLDGEYLASTNTFYIFDVYNYKGKNVARLPLMTTDEDIQKNPLKSRLGCAHVFIQDLLKDFKTLPSSIPIKIQTKMFLAGDGIMMEKAIQKILETQFEYETDGLIFTPKDTPAAPINERSGDRWLTAYKWKPPHQNSIDFLVKFKPESHYDSVLNSDVFKGTLYVGRNSGSDIIYPCETLTGEYVPPKLPSDLEAYSDGKSYVPSPFQPSAPKSMSASDILLPLNPRNVPVDKQGKRVEDNSIIECSRDVEKGRWIVMRTRYDKTYQYRVNNEPSYGNDIWTADNIWTNIHAPVTAEMLESIVSNPPDDTFEDDLYYRSEATSKDKIYEDVRSFHNKVKEELYRSNIKPGDTLLELAVGRAGDLHKWRKFKPSKVVGIDISKSNIEMREGACVRYLKEQAKGIKLPPALFIVADMTIPLSEQDNRYIRILNKQEPPGTEYLEKFVGLNQFDVISCQMAIHYACESEDTFRSFVKNVTDHGKGIFFGTCLDGQAVYTQLLNKQGENFKGQSTFFAQMTKGYEDGNSWTEDFGRSITVKLESFDKPQKEFLVPFGRVVDILKENDYELVSTKMFADYYAEQNEVFTEDYQKFSFLHRSFAFKKTKAPVQLEPLPEAVQSVEDVQQKNVTSEEVEKVETFEKDKKKKITVKVKEERPEPVLFKYGDATLEEFKDFAPESEVSVQVDGIKYPTLQHYFEYQKAKFIGDAAAQSSVLKSKSAKTAKSEGKKVDENIQKDQQKKEEWEKKATEVMYTGLKAKFSQHPELRKKLLDTKDRPIGLSDPREKYWSIGTSGNTAKASKIENWPGSNQFGKLMERLRNELKE